MNRQLHSLTDASDLLRLSDLLSNGLRTIIDEWAKENSTRASSKQQAPPLPSPALYNAQRTVMGIIGKLTELVSEPSIRVIELACQYWESRALYVMAERRVPDLLDKAGERGLSANELSLKTGIEEGKLARIMRCLTSNGVFKELEHEHFANNVVSNSLVGNEPLRAYVLLFNLDLYTASDRLPAYLLGSKGHSYQVDETAFQEAVGTTVPRWNWLEQQVPRDQLAPLGVGYPGMPGMRVGKAEPQTNGNSKAVENATRDPTVAISEKKGADGDISLVSRPEHEVFGMAMLGGGKIFGAAHAYDYPWAELGEAVVVDVGGGVGGFCVQLSTLYPKLKFVVQDRGPVLKQAEAIVWPKESPVALKEGRVTFVQHDFFEPNPVQGADVYWLRYIIHDWSDGYCVDILSAIRTSMSSRSRILICDQVMNTTVGCPELGPAPEPLPANYGFYTRYSHQRDLAMMGIINGIERTPAQFMAIVEKAGLRVHKIWECRSQVSIVELRLSDSSL